MEGIRKSRQGEEGEGEKRKKRKGKGRGEKKGEVKRRPREEERGEILKGALKTVTFLIKTFSQPHEDLKRWSSRMSVCSNSHLSFLSAARMPRFHVP